MAVEKKRQAEMEQAMEIYRKMGTPGEPHKKLARMAGSWDARIVSWIGPDMPPLEWTGSSEQKMLLGCRFLQQEFSGRMMGGLYSGMGVTGYDNHTGKYVSTWMDSMNTGIMVFEGTDGADGGAIVQTAHYDDPARGPVQWRSVTKIVDDDTVLFEMYSTLKGGTEEKMMEITYTRK